MRVVFLGEFALLCDINATIMIAISDCGSSKTEWVVVDDRGNTVDRFVTCGANPAVMGAEELSHAFAEAAPRLRKHNPGHLFFYGAGCLPHLCGAVADTLRRTTGIACVEAESDLLGAARSLLQRSAGIACILGTGSNSCLYDGRSITDNVPSLGFILGDEGSGAYLGRMLLSDMLKRQMPPELSDEFSRRFGLDAATAIRRVYREPSPNRFLASLAPFLADNLSHPSVQNLVVNAFKAFLQRNVAAYGSHTRSLPLAFCGSIAWHFSNELTVAASQTGMKIASICAAPMDGLITYHNNTSI